MKLAYIKNPWTILGSVENQALKHELNIFRTIFGFFPHGVSGHGGHTGLNNQDIFDKFKPADFHLSYEAYDKSPGGIFGTSRYLRDSLWFKWKSYEKGHILENDSRTLLEHISDAPNLLYVLIHPETYCHHLPRDKFKP